jgi:hypothetical protein
MEFEDDMDKLGKIYMGVVDKDLKQRKEANEKIEKRLNESVKMARETLLLHRRQTNALETIAKALTRRK